MSKIFDLSHLSPHELVSRLQDATCKECQKEVNKRGHSDQVYAEEIIRRLYRVMRDENKIVIPDSLAYPGDLNAQHPFEYQLTKGRYRKKLRKDPSLARSMFRLMCFYNLIRERGVWNVQADMFEHTYSVDKFRADKVMCSIGDVRRGFFLNIDPVKETDSAAHVMVSKMGWTIIEKDLFKSPNLLTRNAN